MTTPRMVPEPPRKLQPPSTAGGDSVKFVEIAKVNGLGGVDVEYEQKAAKPRAEGTNDIGENHHLVHVDTAELGPLPHCSQGPKDIYRIWSCSGKHRLIQPPRRGTGKA